MCGADAACKTLAPRVEGSLPHVRGGFIARLDAVDREWFTPACAGRMPTIFHRDACPRFTPACAGRIFEVSRKSFFKRVHPRMCGADDVDIGWRVTNSGSPPHVRGGLGLCRPGAVCMRFTPACAGRIDSDSDSESDSEVHPRMCGADIEDPSGFLTSSGSPP